MTEKQKLDIFFDGLKLRMKAHAREMNVSTYADVAYTEIAYILQVAQDAELIDSWQ